MGVREIAGEVREEADIDDDTVRDVGYLIIGGWLGGLSWNIAAANISIWKKLVLTVIAFLMGLFFLVSLEIARAVGPVVNHRLARDEK